MKYKKLDNLDDLLVGDVIEGRSTMSNVVRIDGELVFVIADNATSIARMLSKKELAYYNFTAKRPLPEKKVKRWRPKKGEFYYMPHPTEDSQKMHLRYTCMSDDLDKEWFERGLVFRTPEEAQEAALKMIKAINPNYDV